MRCGNNLFFGGGWDGVDGWGSDGFGGIFAYIGRKWVMGAYSRFSNGSVREGAVEAYC